MGVPIALIMCGSFDPITRVHLKIFEIAKNFLENDYKIEYNVIKGIISPVNDLSQKIIATNDHRLSMIKLALLESNINWVIVDNNQFNSRNTLQALKYHFNDIRRDTVIKTMIGFNNKDVKVKLLADLNFVEIISLPNQWKHQDIDELFHSFGAIIVPTMDRNLDKLINKYPILSKHSDKILATKECIPIDENEISNENMFKARPLPNHLLHQSVMDYINENHLYQENIRLN